MITAEATTSTPPAKELTGVGRGERRGRRELAAPASQTLTVPGRRTAPSETVTLTVSATAVSPAVAGDFALSANQVLTITAGHVEHGDGDDLSGGQSRTTKRRRRWTLKLDPTSISGRTAARDGDAGSSDRSKR